jgi:hypothetical protein
MEASAPEENRTKPSHDIPDNLARDMDRDALSQLVRDANGGGWGVSYQEMATNAVTTAPSPERLRAIAAGLAKPLAVVQRAAAIQYLDYQATELAGYDDDIRVIVAHLAGMEKSERRRWQAMIEADERAKREDG